MKLFVALLLTLSAQNQAPAHAGEEDDLPNLRGVVGIALTKGTSKKRDESYGTSSSGGTTCKQEGHPCNPDNSGCCSALNCIATGDQVGPSHKCASPLDTSSAAAGDENDGIALTNGEDYGPPIGMAACRKVDQWCSTTSTNHRYQCCDVDELGTTQSLTCQESATVSNPFYNGICVASSSEIEV